MGIEDLKLLYCYLTDPDSVESETIEMIVKKLKLIIDEADVRKEYTDKINDIVQELDQLNNNKDKK